MFPRGRKVKVKYIALVITVTWITYVLGLFNHLFEADYYERFTYPYNVNFRNLLHQLRNNQTPETAPINLYDYKFLINRNDKCATNNIRLVYLVKSALNHFERRSVIRRTWGYERRFSDVQIQTMFVLGNGDDVHLQRKINNESSIFRDIIQVDFKDSYFNNTIKTMMGFKWAFDFCSNSDFYMFVDDDYYVSTRNVLRFIRNPTNYPDYLSQGDEYNFELPKDVRLYAGYVFVSSPHRHLFSKWYVTLDEYAFHMWPPYVTAGAYVLSQKALIDMYHGSFYTKHFRFDDIYLGIIAKKVDIQPFHCKHFYFHKHEYNDDSYRFTIATHGYDSPSELSQIWNRQKAIGNA